MTEGEDNNSSLSTGQNEVTSIYEEAGFTPVEESQPVVTGNESTESATQTETVGTEAQTTSETSEGETTPTETALETENQHPDQAQLTDEMRSMALNEMFGDQFSSFEEVASANLVERYNKYDEIVEAHDALVDEIEQLEAREPQYASEVVKNFNDWVTKGGKPEDFISVQTVNFDEMQPLDVLAYQMQRENPNLSKSDIQKYLEGEYKQDLEMYTEEEAASGKIKLQIEANKAMGSLKQMQQDTSVPEAFQQQTQSQEESEAEKQELMNNWEPNITKAVTSFESVQIPINDNVSFNWKVEPAELEQIKQDLYDTIELTKMPMDEQGVQEAHEYVMNRYMAQNWQKVVAAVANQARTMSDEQWFKETHNPSATQTQSENVGNTTPKSIDDQFLDLLEG